MTSPTRYPASFRAIHWATVLCVLFAYGVTYAEALFARGTPERAMVWWLHISVGLLVLAFTLARVGLHGVVRLPPPSPAVTGLTALAAKGAHIALYLLLLAVPLVGIWLAFLRGTDVSFFGLFSIPSPVAVDRAAAGNVKEVHEWLANGLLAVAALHAAAALWHHFVRRDDVLTRMLPGR
jgi:cytochrome b561